MDEGNLTKKICKKSESPFRLYIRAFKLTKPSQWFSMAIKYFESVNSKIVHLSTFLKERLGELQIFTIHQFDLKKKHFF